MTSSALPRLAAAVFAASLSFMSIAAFADDTTPTANTTVQPVPQQTAQVPATPATPTVVHNNPNTTPPWSDMRMGDGAPYDSSGLPDSRWEENQGF